MWRVANGLDNADLVESLLSVEEVLLRQWFPNFFGSRTTWKNLVVREGQNIDLYRDSRTTSANLGDHHWSAEQTLGITVLRSQKETTRHV
jgi:hypothetical protein